MFTKKILLIIGVMGALTSRELLAAPIIKSVLTSYSAAGTPLAITIFGTGLCEPVDCTIKPIVSLGGAATYRLGGNFHGHRR